MKPFILAFFLIFSFSFSTFAKIAPYNPPSLIYQGKKYVGAHEGDYLEIQEIKTGKVLEKIQIYKTKINPNLEDDVQWIFITEITAEIEQIETPTGKKVEREYLLIENQIGEKFDFDPKTKKVLKISQKQGL